MSTWVGTSGWSYRHWRHVFYPDGVAQRRWLEFYAARFSTVEINATFYRLPPATTFDAWSARVPPGFRFSVKISRYLTHTKRLQEPAEAWGRLATACDHLGRRLGVYLAQLPPRFSPDPQRLDEFLAAAPRQVPLAVEFRDPAWFVPEIEETLRNQGAALVWSDYPGVAAPDWVTAPFLYVRCHGAGERYSGRYGTDRLRRLAARIAEFEGDVFCYFNNDAAGAAIADAEELVELLGEATGDRTA